MKTEQEQIKEIADVLCDYCKNNTKIGEPCKSSNGTYICTSEIRRATAIVQAGYGDVSEYKAEIERLNSNNGFLQCVISHSKDMMDEAVKEAQIDVLKKVKDIVFDYLGVKNIKEAEALSLLDSTLTYDVVTCGIDELIKEIENEQKD